MQCIHPAKSPFLSADPMVWREMWYNIILKCKNMHEENARQTDEDLTYA